MSLHALLASVPPGRIYVSVDVLAQWIPSLSDHDHTTRRALFEVIGGVPQRFYGARGIVTLCRDSQENDIRYWMYLVRP